MPLPPNVPVSIEYVPAGDSNPFVVAWRGQDGGEWRVSFDSYGAASEKFIQRVRRWREQEAEDLAQALGQGQKETQNAPSE